MNIWLKLVFPPVVALSAWGCSSSVASSMAPASSSVGGCAGQTCANSGGAPAGSADASAAGGASVIRNNYVDAGTGWSSLCGPEGAGCDSDAGFCDDINELDPTMDAGSYGGDADSGPESVSLTCRISLVADAVERRCDVAGPGSSGAPCRTPTDCGVGLTCVAEDLVGLCRPYCCANAESCPSNSYCAIRTTLVDKDSWALGSDVPVCTPAENCRLTDTYPCPSGMNCSCSAGKACMIVRSLGLTACVKPGTGTQGDYCPCAAGYVCSNVTFTCLKLCQLTSNSQNSQAGCDTGTSCQASSDVPKDWGVCNDKPLLIN
jgi:hypothetical protein